MKPKKNFNKDLNRRRSLYFAGSLTAMLTICYIALEWKTATNNYGYETNTAIQKEKSAIILHTVATPQKTSSEACVNGKKDSIAEKTVNYMIVDEVPIYPGCEKEKNKRSCFSKMIRKHIIRNLNYPKNTTNQNLTSTIHIQFEVNSNGNIRKIKIDSPYKELENEVFNTIEKLPQMTAAKHQGKVVSTIYKIPLSLHFK